MIQIISGLAEQRPGGKQDLNNASFFDNHGSSAEK